MSAGRDHKKRTAAFITLGCKANRYDSSAMMGMIPESLYTIIDDSSRPAGPIHADVYVINTCAVTGKSAFQSRQMVRRVKRWNPEARVVVTGCLAELDKPSLLAAGADLVAGLAERDLVIRCLEGQPPCPSSVFHHPEGGRQARGRAVVKIQDGCDLRCSYCIVSTARGRSRSLAEPLVLGQLRALAGRGFAEVVLTGIHLGLYGKDTGTSIAGLIEKIAAEAGMPERIRISSLEPMELTTELIAVMARSRKVCPHLHLPVQSGDSETLKRMRRPYPAEIIEELVHAVIAAMPRAGIGLDLIAGFPGESEQAHENTRVLVASLPVAYLHVFPFSRRPGTPAADMPEQIAAAVIKQRARELRDLGTEKKRSFLQAQKGRVLQVLAETRSGGEITGTSENYVSVIMPGPSDLAGRILPVRVTRVCAGHVKGVIEDDGRADATDKGDAGLPELEKPPRRA